MPHLFGEKLRSLRLQRGLVQVDLARQLGLRGQSHITNIETGKDVPSLALIIRVANLFGVTLDALLRDSVPVDLVVPSDAVVVLPEPLVLDAFAQRLRLLRLQHQVSQVELAQRLGLTRQAYISNLEAGRKLPSLDLVMQIADLFGVVTDELFHN